MGRTKLGDAVRERRLTQELTLRKVAEKCGVTMTYISEIETGKKVPQKTTVLEKLEEVLSVKKGTFVDFATQEQIIGIVSSARPESKRVLLARKLASLTDDEVDNILSALKEEK